MVQITWFKACKAVVLKLWRTSKSPGGWGKIAEDLALSHLSKPELCTLYELSRWCWCTPRESQLQRREVQSGAQSLLSFSFSPFLHKGPSFISWSRPPEALGSHHFQFMFQRGTRIFWTSALRVLGKDSDWSILVQTLDLSQIHLLITTSWGLSMLELLSILRVTGGKEWCDHSLLQPHGMGEAEVSNVLKQGRKGCWSQNCLNPSVTKKRTLK